MVPSSNLEGSIVCPLQQISSTITTHPKNSSMKSTNMHLKLLLLAAIVMVAAVKALSSTTTKSNAINRRQVLLAQVIGCSIVLTGPHLATAASEESPKLSEEERQEVLQRLEERHQLMQASRSTSNRQDYLDLSRQRAKLYNTTSKAWSCPPNIPCI
jgi:hypothetical protein